MMSNLENNVYTRVAKKYNSNKKTVKSNIVKATNNMDNVKAKKIGKIEVFKYTPKMVIYYVVDKIINS